MDTVTIHTINEALEVPCIPTPVPGLVLANVHSGLWYSVTHERSGMGLGAFRDPETAALYMTRLPDIDWTLSGSELVSIDHLWRSQMLAQLEDLGGHLGPTGRHNAEALTR